ncbi:hypothetical protein [Leptospira sp. GIMC2001]|uniref:hypothetical protein n=1 Tax=Leptospira sp. GIMC2001 TaxID=1513297 RepID=UPI002349F816|nr:hypothetical protein [Leptospira sp. GIMC2001]WCL51458.1 hypothetical protein O4O04_20290 [Leptospira sp. GIMC2001]
MSKEHTITEEIFSILDTYTLLRDAKVSHENAVKVLKEKGWVDQANTIDFLNGGLSDETYNEYFRDQKLQDAPLPDSVIRVA